MLFGRCCKSGLIFDSKRVLEIHGPATCPSVLQVCTLNVPWRPAVDDVQTCLIVVEWLIRSPLWRTMFARSAGNESSWALKSPVVIMASLVNSGEYTETIQLHGVTL